ncbi:hypothetical protein GRI33_00935 [Brucella sp. BO3]|uniref:hypothetical protein n=1 Tax=unclassified Brucella TaxID=2632610 RepID=UPI00084F93AE|nr:MULTISPECIES: hypothetical protein [unclassified Brucella]OEI84422.1 hypothetical protein BA060_03805 [Brucella sp. B13-0095]QMV25578.1 hypothetical protein GRI33_00935 [Brucella sp. BO3]
MAIDFNITRRGALQRFVGAGAILSVGMPTITFAHDTPPAEYFLEYLESMFSETWARITDAGGIYQRYQDAVSLAEVIAIVPAQTLAGAALKAQVAASAKALGNDIIKLPFETRRRLEIRAQVERKALGA